MNSLRKTMIFSATLAVIFNQTPALWAQSRQAPVEKVPAIFTDDLALPTGGNIFSASQAGQNGELRGAFLPRATKLGANPRVNILKAWRASERILGLPSGVNVHPALFRAARALFPVSILNSASEGRADGKINPRWANVPIVGSLDREADLIYRALKNSIGQASSELWALYAKASPRVNSESFSLLAAPGESSGARGSGGGLGGAGGVIPEWWAPRTKLQVGKAVHLPTGEIAITLTAFGETDDEVYSIALTKPADVRDVIKAHFERFHSVSQESADHEITTANVREFIQLLKEVRSRPEYGQLQPGSKEAVEAFLSELNARLVNHGPLPPVPFVAAYWWTADQLQKFIDQYGNAIKKSDPRVRGYEIYWHEGIQASAIAIRVDVTNRQTSYDELVVIRNNIEEKVAAVKSLPFFQLAYAPRYKEAVETKE